MKKIEKKDISYKELLIVDGDEQACDVLGISEGGELLYISEKKAQSGSAYSLDREFFRIDSDEYMGYMRTAAKNSNLQEALAEGTVLLEVCLKGRYFKAGSSVKFIVSQHKCSVFSGDSEYAEKNGFEKIDKFEYAKTLRISDLDKVRISHIDTENESVLAKHEMKPAEFEAWLDTVKQ